MTKTNYIVIIDEYTPGSEPSPDLVAFGERMCTYLTEHADADEMAFEVNTSELSGQSAQLYEIAPNGEWHSLYRSRQSDEVAELLNLAWTHACETDYPAEVAS